MIVSSDQENVTYFGSKSKARIVSITFAFLDLFIFAFFIIFLLNYHNYPSPDGLGALIALFGLALLISSTCSIWCWWAVKPASMTLSPQGLSIRLFNKTQTWAWSQVIDPRTVQGGGLIIFGPTNSLYQERRIMPIWAASPSSIVTGLKSSKLKWQQPSPTEPQVRTPFPVLSTIQGAAAIAIVAGLWIMKVASHHTT